MVPTPKRKSVPYKPDSQVDKYFSADAVSLTLDSGLYSNNSLFRLSSVIKDWDLRLKLNVCNFKAGHRVNLSEYPEHLLAEVSSLHFQSATNVPFFE